MKVKNYEKSQLFVSVANSMLYVLNNPKSISLLNLPSPGCDGVGVSRT